MAVGIPPVRVSHRPAALSAAAAVAAALTAVATLNAAARPALAVEAFGLLLVGAAVHLQDDYGRAVAPVAAAGGVVAFGSLGLAAETLATPSARLEVLPGMVGVAVVAAGVLAPDRRPRTLLRIGTGLVFVGVLVCGVMRDASLAALLASTAAVVVAWDVGDNAVGVGEQLGSVARTRSVELLHLGTTLLVAALAVLTGVVVAGLRTSSLPLSSFVLLFVAVLLFAVALHD